MESEGTSSATKFNNWSSASQTSTRTTCNRERPVGTSGAKWHPYHGNWRSNDLAIYQLHPVAALSELVIGWLLDWFIDSLTHWLIDSLIDWFIDWLIDIFTSPLPVRYQLPATNHPLGCFASGDNPHQDQGNIPRNGRWNGCIIEKGSSPCLISVTYIHVYIVLPFSILTIFIPHTFLHFLSWLSPILA